MTHSIPTWGGLSANVHYQFGEQIGTGLKHKGNAGIDVMYRNGPLALTAIYERAQRQSVGTTLYAGNDTRKDWTLGATYDFSVVKLFLTYGEAERAATNQKFKTAQAGVSIPRRRRQDPRVGGPDTSHRTGRLYRCRADLLALGRRLRQVQGTTATVGYDYFLSKRTDLYVNVMHDRVTDLTSGTSVGLGMRHRFDPRAAGMQRRGTRASAQTRGRGRRAGRVSRRCRPRRWRDDPAPAPVPSAPAPGAAAPPS